MPTHARALPPPRPQYLAGVALLLVVFIAFALELTVRRAVPCCCRKKIEPYRAV
jgi:hypothetical protein